MGGAWEEDLLLAVGVHYRHSDLLYSGHHYGILVPRPRPAFCRLQYGKAGEGLVFFSRE